MSNKITRNASDQLLSLLKDYGHDQLPKCTQTLLKTPQNVSINEKCGGGYVYLGIATCIKRIISDNKDLQLPEMISLAINIDGIPIFKSSPDQIWPILGKFAKYPVFAISLWHGKGKPSSIEEFLNDFLLEYTLLSQNGFEYNGLCFQVEFKVFICDAPARQFVKNIKSHNGYFSCERCTIKRTWKSHRLLMHQSDCPETCFENYEYLGTHQIGKTRLIDHKISCIHIVVIDYVHLVCLGVVKRILILYLKEGPRICRLSEHQLTIISELLESYKGKCPS